MLKSPSNRWILVAAFLAMALKLIFAFHTIGTNDTLAFYFFSNDLRTKGLIDVYEKNVIFNHTPLTASYISAISGFAETSWQKKEAFPFLLRLPGIIADFLSAFILMRLRHTTGNPPLWAVMTFILSPLALMISGFHGNVDSILALGMLAALWLAFENRPALSGLALGLACNVKVAPLLIIPAFFAWWLGRKRALPFSLSLGGAVLIGWSPGLLGAPHAFLAHVLGYPGYWGSWGYSFLLTQTGDPIWGKSGFIGMSSAQTFVMAASKYTIIAAALWMSWVRRKTDTDGLARTVTWTWLVFFSVATGIAPQYFVWLAPFLLLSAPRWSAAFISAGSIGLFAFYNCLVHTTNIGDKFASCTVWTMPWDDAFKPWYYAHSDRAQTVYHGPWQILTWLVCIGALVWLSHIIRREKSADA